MPDFFVETSAGCWVIDVRPAGRIQERDAIAFAASAELATSLGWGYRVVTGWDPVAAATVDALSAQRRPLTDRLEMVETVLDAVEDGPRPFGEVAAATTAPAVARAYLLHLLWHRRLTMDIRLPLGDDTLVGLAR